MENEFKLELELEILILRHNIEKLKKLGFPIEPLQNRLKVCSAEMEAMQKIDSVKYKAA